MYTHVACRRYQGVQLLMYVHKTSTEGAFTDQPLEEEGEQERPKGKKQKKEGTQLRKSKSIMSENTH